MHTKVTASYFTPQAWVGGEAGSQWAYNVRMDVASDGLWQAITPNASAEGATQLHGPVLPGVVNAHSHAFQRAIAGLTERSAGNGAGKDDDFWSWRERMYRAALRITPAQLEAIATQLYAELLQGGYTHVCEFHYLHNDTDGKPYSNPLEMALALVRAAQNTGIGLTLVPTLYMHSGFGVQTAAGTNPQNLREEQRRFAGTPNTVLRMAEAMNALALPNVNAGLALHSLRAVDPAALKEASIEALRKGWPIHIHIAEQVQEVQDCLAHHGQRPVEWLLNHAAVNAQWNLVHATHANAQELQGVQAAGASIVLCPSTEANLGDGVFDLPTHLQLQGRWSIGSDSHVTRDLSEELRLLEYSQRFARRQRNVAAAASSVHGVNGVGSTAAVLLQGAVQGGSAAAGIAANGLQAGQRADFCVLGANAPALAGIPSNHLLDAWVFSSPSAGVAATYVAGREVPRKQGEWQHGFVSAMRDLWG